MPDSKKPSFISHECDKAVERWLCEDVAPVYDAMKAEPARAFPADEVFAAVRARHADGLKSRGSALVERRSSR